jgi:hypothetical protein
VLHTNRSGIQGAALGETVGHVRVAHLPTGRTGPRYALMKIEDIETRGSDALQSTADASPADSGRADGGAADGRRPTPARARRNVCNSASSAPYGWSR